MIIVCYTNKLWATPEHGNKQRFWPCKKLITRPWIFRFQRFDLSFPCAFAYAGEWDTQSVSAAPVKGYRKSATTAFYFIKDADANNFTSSNYRRLWLHLADKHDLFLTFLLSNGATSWRRSLLNRFGTVAAWSRMRTSWDVTLFGKSVRTMWNPNHCGAECFTGASTHCYSQQQRIFIAMKMICNLLVRLCVQNLADKAWAQRKKSPTWTTCGSSSRSHWNTATRCLNWICKGHDSKFQVKIKCATEQWQHQIIRWSPWGARRLTEAGQTGKCGGTFP